jgi:hypothetical protein
VFEVYCNVCSVVEVVLYAFSVRSRSVVRVGRSQRTVWSRVLLMGEIRRRQTWENEDGTKEQSQCGIWCFLEGQEVRHVDNEKHKHW